MRRFFQKLAAMCLMIVFFVSQDFLFSRAHAQSQCDTLPTGGPRESCEDANRRATDPELDAALNYDIKGRMDKIRENDEESKKAAEKATQDPAKACAIDRLADLATKA